MKKTVIHEIMIEGEEVEVLSWTPIAVIPYGSQGFEPAVRRECLLKDEHVSCVGGSGSNLCGYYMGHVASNVIRCAILKAEE